MTIVGNQRTVRCANCNRTMHPDRVKGGSAQTKAVVIVAGQLAPLQCTHCGQIVCHECQGGKTSLGASQASLFCQSCDQMLDVLAYAPAAGGDSTSRGGSAMLVIGAVVVVAAIIYFVLGH